MPAAAIAIHVPAATVEAILAAIPNHQPQSPQMIEKLSRWLGRKADRAILHFKPRLTMDDVDELDRACRELRRVVEKLQDRRIPPPLHTENTAFKELEEWADLGQVFGFKLGPGEGKYWDLTFALLGLYEFASAKPGFTVKANSATMRFLQAALGELAKLVPPEARKCFSLPEQGTLKKQLKANPHDVPSKKRALARLQGSQG